MQFRTHRGGILLLDVLVGVAVFAILVGSVIFTLLMAQRSILKSGDRMQAVFYAQQALEAVRSMRDDDFASIQTAGTYGLAVQGGVWTLVGPSPESSDWNGFTVSVTLANVDSDTVSAQADVSWDVSALRSGNVSLSTQYTDWHRLIPIGNWSSLALDGSYEGDLGEPTEKTPLFNDAVATDEYLYVTGDLYNTSVGAGGLYIFNIQQTNNPTFIKTVDIGSAGHDVAVSGDYLFVLTEVSNAEIKVYDIAADPENPVFKTSVNIDAGDAASAFDIKGDYLYVVSRAYTAGSNADSISMYTLANLPNSLTSLGTFSPNPKEDYNSVSVVGNYAYIAHASTSKEFTVVNVLNPASMSQATAKDPTGDVMGTDIKAVSNYALLGRMNTGLGNDITLYDIVDPPVDEGNGPWYHGVSAHVHAVDMDPSETYGFVASENDGKELVVLGIPTFASGGGNPELTVYTTPDGIGVGRGVHYSWIHDRVILLTNESVIILRPTGT